MTRLFRLGISLDNRKKDLSAHTIASFLVAQCVSSVPELRANREMNAAALQFINRDSAINHWLSTGRLAMSGNALVLTEAGVRECVERESGEARDAAGRRKKECVTPELIQVMRLAILEGRYTDATISFDHQEFNL